MAASSPVAGSESPAAPGAADTAVVARCARLTALAQSPPLGDADWQPRRHRIRARRVPQGGTIRRLRPAPPPWAHDVRLLCRLPSRRQRCRDRVEPRRQPKDANTIGVWDGCTGHRKHTAHTYNYNVQMVNYNSTGAQLVSCSFDKKVTVWDMAAPVPQRLRTLSGPSGHTDFVLSAVFGPGDARIASTSLDKCIKIWNTNTWNCDITLGRPLAVNSAHFHPQGTQLVSGDHAKEVVLWDLNTGQRVGVCSGPRSHDGKVTQVVFDPAGGVIASASYDRTVKPTDPRTLHCVRTIKGAHGHDGRVLSVDFDAAGARFVSGSADHTAKVWDVRSARCLRTLHGHTHFVRARFDATGSRIVTTSYDKTARVWPLEWSPASHHLFPAHHRCSVRAALLDFMRETD
jgi:WD40 repeat protein